MENQNRDVLNTLCEIKINLQKIANKAAGQKVIFEGQQIEISENVRLYRFAFEAEPNDFNRMHLLTDGGGGYRIIFNPDTPNARVVEGNLMERKLYTQMDDAELSVALNAAQQHNPKTGFFQDAEAVLAIKLEKNQRKVVATEPEVVYSDESFIDVVVYVTEPGVGDWKFTVSKDLSSNEISRTIEFSKVDDHFDETDKEVPTDVEAAFQSVKANAMQAIEAHLATLKTVQRKEVAFKSLDQYVLNQLQSLSGGQLTILVNEVIQRGYKGEDLGVLVDVLNCRFDVSLSVFDDNDPDQATAQSVLFLEAEADAVLSRKVVVEDKTGDIPVSVILDVPHLLAAGIISIARTHSLEIKSEAMRDTIDFYAKTRNIEATEVQRTEACRIAEHLWAETDGGDQSGAYVLGVARKHQQGELVEPEEGWFNVEIFETQEDWDGYCDPVLGLECHHVIEGVATLATAQKIMDSPEFADCHQICIVAHGEHAKFERFETVASRLDLKATIGLKQEQGKGRDLKPDVEGAQLFFKELLNSVETLEGIAEQYGVRTLTDLMYLQQAILKGETIEVWPGETEVGKVLQNLPSAIRWLQHTELGGEWKHACVYVDNLSPNSKPKGSKP